MTTVLVVEASTYPTGALKSILAVASHLKGRVSFEFAMDERSAAAAMVASLGMPVHDLRVATLSRSPAALVYPFRLASNGLAVNRIARKIRADVVHVNDIHVLAGASARLFGGRVPLVQHCRLLRSSYIGPLYPFFAAIGKMTADSLIAVSRAVADDFGPCPSMSIVHDAMSAAPRLPRKAYRDHRQGCRFLCVGNFVRGKGHDIALRAFARVAEELPDSTLQMVGAGSRGELDAHYVNGIQAARQHTGLSDRISLEGRVDDIEPLMKHADVVVNFSVSESFSMVCLEAMTYGLPLIAADSGGPGELIDDGRTGLLVRVRDVEAAAGAMRRLGADPRLARRLGTQASLEVPVRYSIDSAADRLHAIYRGLCSPSAAS